MQSWKRSLFREQARTLADMVHAGASEVAGVGVAGVVEAVMTSGVVGVVEAAGVVTTSEAVEAVEAVEAAEAAVGMVFSPYQRPIVVS